MDLPGLYPCVWKLLLYALIHLRSLKEMLLLPSVNESDSLQVRIRTSRRWLVSEHPEAVDTVPEHQGLILRGQESSLIRVGLRKKYP